MFPELDLVQNRATGSLEATPTVAMSIFGLLCAAEVVENDRIGYEGTALNDCHLEHGDGGHPNPGPVGRGYFACPDIRGKGIHHRFQDFIVDCCLSRHL